MDASPPSPPPSSSVSLPSPSLASLDPSYSVSSASSTTQDARPLPLLPSELKKHILRFCDPSTLAKTSTLSLAFLELSSPLLYDEINITGFEDLAKLFCTRVMFYSTISNTPSQHQPQLESYLSLTRIRSFTFTEPSSIPFPVPHLSSKRFPSTASTVEVDSLTLNLSQDANHWGDRYRSCWETFFLFLNPRSLHAIGVKSSSPTPTIDLRTAAWPNLSLLSFDGCLGDSLRDWTCLRGDGEEVAIVLLLALDSGPSVLRNAYECTNKASRRVNNVLVRSSSNGLSVHVQEALNELWEGLEVTGAELARRKSLITYEIQDEEEVGGVVAFFTQN